MSVKLKNFLLPLLLLILSFGLYINSFHGEFVIDDYFFIDRPQFATISRLPNLFVEPLLPWFIEAGLYRPVLSTTMAVQLILFGKNTLPFHIFNACLNSFNIILLFWLTQKLFKNKTLALFTSLIFLTLPIHTEAVAYIKARDELLSTFFSLVSWLIFTKAVSQKKISWLKICLSALVIFPGLLSKEFALVNWGLFILVALLQKHIRLKQAIAIGAIFLIPTFAYTVLRYRALGQNFFGDTINYISNPLKWETDFAPRFWTPFRIAYIYISKTFVPLNLSASYHYPQVPPVINPLTAPSTLIGLAFMAVLLFLALSPKTINRPAGLGSLIFLYLYLPFSQIFIRAGDMVGERWMYFPSYGLSLIFAYLIYLLFIKNKLFGLSLLLITLTIYSYLTLTRNQIWKDPMTLYLATLKSAPNGCKFYISAGYLYLEQGDLPKAKIMGEKSLALFDRYAPAYDLLGAIAYRKNDYDQSMAYLNQAIQTDPEFYNVYQNLARVYYIKGQFPTALELVTRYVNQTPTELKIPEKIFYAMVMAKNRQFQKSLDFVTKYLANDLKYPEARFVYAVNLYHLGKPQQARYYMTWRQNATYQEMLKEIITFPATASDQKN